MSSQILSTIIDYINKRVAKTLVGNFKGSLRHDMTDQDDRIWEIFVEGEFDRALTNHQENYYLLTDSKLSDSIWARSLSKGLLNILHIIWKK